MRQEFESAGINIPNDTKGMSVKMSFEGRGMPLAKTKYIKWNENSVASDVLDLGMVCPITYVDVTNKVKILAFE